MTHPLIIATACADPDVARDLVSIEVIRTATQKFGAYLSQTLVDAWFGELGPMRPVDGGGK